MSKSNRLHGIALFLLFAESISAGDLPTLLPKEPVGSISTREERKLDDIDKVYRGIPPVQYLPPLDRLRHLPKTLAKLRSGGLLRVVMLGDSIINDTSRSGWCMLVERANPGCKITKVTSVRGGTGCWWYKEYDRVQRYVLDQHPDLVIIGGISQRDDVDSIREVVRQVRAKSDADVFFMTGPFGGIDPTVDAQWCRVTEPGPNDYSVRLRKLADEVGAEFLDLQRAWGEYIRTCGKPLNTFKRDHVHANAAGEQILAHILETYFAPLDKR